MCFSIAGRTENNLTILNITTFGHVKLTLAGTILSSPFHHWEFNENFSPCPFFSSLNSRWSLRRGYILSSVIFSWLLNVACSFKGDTEFNEKFFVISLSTHPKNCRSAKLWLQKCVLVPKCFRKNYFSGNGFSKLLLSVFVCVCHV